MKKTILICLFALLGVAHGSWAMDYITDVLLIGGSETWTNSAKAWYEERDWTVINYDLNRRAGGSYIYLLYKTSSSSEGAITDFYIKHGDTEDHPETLTHNGRTYHLVTTGGNENFNASGGDLNYNTKYSGDKIYLYYTTDAFTPARAVTDIKFDTNADLAVTANGGTKACDLNDGTIIGADIYMHPVITTLVNPFEVSTEAQLRKAVSLNGADIRLTDNINIGSELTVGGYGYVSVTIDLNGHTLNRGLTSSASYGHVLKIIKGSKLTINDSSGDNSGRITGAYAYDGGAINNAGTLIVNGGTISGNNCIKKGSGIWNRSGATATINGGVINGNNTTGEGGGIYNEGKLNMSGNPVVKENTANEKASNVVLNESSINVTGPFVSGAEIWLTTGMVDCVLTTGYSAHNTEAPSTFFKIDGGKGSVSLNTSLDPAEAYYSSQYEYITDVIIVNSKNSKNARMNEGWTAIDYDLNKGAGGSYVYLLYKTTKSMGSSGEPITDFYIRTGKNPPASLTYNGRTYYSPDENCDLNHGAGGNFIYLYYTKDAFPDGHAITGIWFDGAQNGGVPADGGVEGFDLNNGAGGNYIYMHISYPQIDTFPYVVCSWDAEKKKVIETTRTLSSGFTRLTSNTSSGHTVLANGWYVVDNSIEYKEYLDIGGDDVNIVLANSKTLRACKGIRIPTDCRLRIYAQPEGTGRINAIAKSGPGIGAYGDIYAGHLEIHGGIIDAKSGSNNNAAIGAGNGDRNKGTGYQSITIYGGTVTAKGSSSGAGIGGGQENDRGKAGPITIYGGTVKATGGSYAAGIGGGEESSNGLITIYGGTVIAQGGDEAAGIGCGEDSHFGDNLYILGGNVTAIGGKQGNGIGTSEINRFTDKKGEVFIENATVTVKGGYDQNAIFVDKISILNSIVDVKVTYGERSQDGGSTTSSHWNAISANTYTLGDNIRVGSESAGNRLRKLKGDAWNEAADKIYIQPCDHSKGTLSYTDNGDGTHTLTGCYYCLGETMPHSYVKQSGSYVCENCSAEKPMETVVFNVTLYTYDGSNWEGQSSTMAKDSKYILPSKSDIPGYEFVGWVTVDESPSTDIFELAQGESLMYPGHEVRVQNDMKFAARYRQTSITLANDASNEDVLTENLMSVRDVTLVDRKLWKDDTWNTLCLPFSLTDEELAASQLSGYTGLKELDVKGYYDEAGTHYVYHEKVDEEDAMETGYYDDTSNPYDGDASSLRQTGFDSSTGTLYLFFQDATSIEAGMPYIVKWATAEPNYFEAPVFSGVYIDNITPTGITSSDGMVTFTGTYAPIEIGKEGNVTILYLGSDNKLYYPNAEMTVGCQRAYFQLNGITAGDPTNGINNFVLNFGDDATGIVDADLKSASQESESSDAWYDLQGRRLSGKPSRAGVYINNGKKIKVK